MLEVEVVTMTELGEIPEVGRRERAISRLKQKSDFRAHLFAYLVVNASLVVVWLAIGAGFFWPIFPMLGWGIGLVFHAWDVYWRKPISEEQIRHEMEHMA
jgi:hypothetical protein